MDGEVGELLPSGGTGDDDDGGSGGAANAAGGLGKGSSAAWRSCKVEAVFSNRSHFDDSRGSALHVRELQSRLGVTNSRHEEVLLH